MKARGLRWRDFRIYIHVQGVLNPTKFYAFDTTVRLTWGECVWRTGTVNTWIASERPYIFLDRRIENMILNHENEA
jgi:hypothetical protein